LGLTLGLVALAVLVAGCGGGAKSSTGTAASGSSAPKYAGIAATPVKPAPPLSLTDSLGRRVDLNQYRGKAVLITFIYVHCPDVCPLIVGNLHSAQEQLGSQADKLQIIAVSVDPKGDTPATVKTFLSQHQMTGRMEYLLGSRSQLEPVWRAWHVLSKATPSKSDPDLVEHSALIYGVSASGKISSLYPQNFKPEQIVHDVPILASE
jgi:protein SCO1/2